MYVKFVSVKNLSSIVIILFILDRQNFHFSQCTGFIESEKKWQCVRNHCSISNMGRFVKKTAQSCGNKKRNEKLSITNIEIENE